MRVYQLVNVSYTRDRLTVVATNDKTLATLAAEIIRHDPEAAQDKNQINSWRTKFPGQLMFLVVKFLCENGFEPFAVSEMGGYYLRRSDEGEPT